jgi:hypothetical protein
MLVAPGTGTLGTRAGGGTERTPPAGIRVPGGPPTGRMLGRTVCGGRTLAGGTPAAGRGFAGTSDAGFAGGGASIVAMSSSSEDWSDAHRSHKIGERDTSGRGTRVPH